MTLYWNINAVMGGEHVQDRPGLKRAQMRIEIGKTRCNPLMLELEGRIQYPFCFRYSLRPLPETCVVP